MQHNKLYGKINKDYSKDIDLPTATAKPTKATIPTIANLATHSPLDQPPPSTTTSFDPYGIPTPPLEDQFLPYDLINDPLDNVSPDDTIQTENLEVSLPPSANLCVTSPDSSTTTPFVDLLFDPTDYLHFSS
jgi:hypothetical protein